MTNKYEKKMDKELKIVIYVAIFLIVLGSLSGNDRLVDFVSNNLGKVLIFIVTGAFCSAVVQNLTGDYLEGILIPIKIGEVRFSISAFVVVSTILSFILF